MDGRREIPRTGLLIMKRLLLTVFFIITANMIFSQEAELAEIQNFSVQVNYDSLIIAGRPWNFTLIIDYPEPDEINVIQPMNSFLTLDRITKSPRLIEERVQTVVDYRFIPVRAGGFTLESFVVVFPNGGTATDQVFLNIQSENESQRQRVIQLAWGGEDSRQAVPSRIEMGKRTVLTLRSSSGVQRLPAGFFNPEIPAGLILTAMHVTEEENEAGIFAKFELIALEENINFPQRTLQLENTVFQIPALRITVIKNQTEEKIEEETEITEKADTNADDLFFSRLTPETEKQRIIRLIYFYSFLFLVIIIIIICLYFILRKK